MSKDDDAKNKAGRPSVDSEAVNVRCERTLLNQIDAWRTSRQSELTRPKAIRHFISSALNSWNQHYGKGQKMTPTERELLLFLSQMVAKEIANDLRDHGLKPDEGRGGSFIRKIIELSEKVRIEAEKDT